MTQTDDDSKELRLADAGRSEKTDDLALRAAFTDDVANLCVDIAKDDLVFVRKTDVVDLEKRFAVSAARGHGWSSQVHELLSFFKLQIRSREQEFLRQPQRVILKQSNQQNGDLNGEHSLKPEMLILIEEQGADTALRPRDAFDHGEHHPAHGGVLAHRIESGVGLAQHNHFPDDAPLAHA